MPKLAVSNKVVVPVKFGMQDGAKVTPFKFSLICDRLPTDEFQERIKDDKGVPTNAKIKELMTKITTGWDGQTFILEDDGTPAAFNEENLEMMLGAAGVLDLVVESYMKEGAARAKN
ncbi:MAG: hypothetical protein M3Y65_16330 [Pseudomonadota bacterium]|nr:hypothetical protein [Pseudomonadota bacterium]